MIRLAKESLQQEPPPQVEYPETGEEIAAPAEAEPDEPTARFEDPAPIRPRPQPHRRGMRQSRQPRPPSPFEPPASGSGRAVAGAITLALFILGIAVFLAAVSVTP
ncbi:MAG: hypothetical protein GWN32_17175 [Gemmatimonadetes bacterium]|nr:hypothetical protein [Gemmatimonadota bacterium]